MNVLPQSRITESNVANSIFEVSFESIITLCVNQALNSTGDTNQLLREIHVDMNNDLKKRLKEMKAQLKRSRRRKKPKKGKTKKKINRRRHQKKKKSQTKKQKMSSE